MTKKIDIYLRHSGGRTLLNLYVPEDMKEQLIDAIRRGSFEPEEASIELEMPILKEWRNEQNPDHLKIEISAINVNYSNEE